MTKHKLLLFASQYQSSLSANGICARNLVRAFVSQGHDVFVIAVSEGKEEDHTKMDGADIWLIPQEWHIRFHQSLSRRNNLLSKHLLPLYIFFRAFVVALFYPNESRFRVRRITKVAEQLIDQHHIDTVIGTCLPYDGIPSSIKLKNKYGNSIRVITYHFDLMSTPNNSNRLFVSYKRWKYKKAFDHELTCVDGVFLPESAMGMTDSSKISYVGLPVFIKEQNIIDVDFSFNNDAYNICYVGTVDMGNRPILPVIEIMREINSKSQKKYILHFWGGVKDPTFLSSLETYRDCFIYHGNLKNEYAFSVMMKSDYLLNISNKLLYNLIPSKIFSLFATGKPIINIVYNRTDCTLHFFEEYGNCVRINVYDMHIDLTMIERIKGNFKDVKGLYDNYTPSFITSKLLA